jgi:hypothetical protein
VVITQALAIAFATNSIGNHALAHMMSLGFFFLLCPGEYTISPSNSTPFLCGQDVSLKVAGRLLDPHTATKDQLLNADFVTLKFDTLPSPASRIIRTTCFTIHGLEVSGIVLYF